MKVLYTQKVPKEMLTYVQERFKTCLGRNQFEQS